MALSKKLAQRIFPTPDPDPLGIAKVVAEISPRLEEAYYAWLEALLRKFVLVGLEPAVLHRIVDAGTVQGRPVTSASRSPSTRAMRQDLLAWTAH